MKHTYRVLLVLVLIIILASSLTTRTVPATQAASTSAATVPSAPATPTSAGQTSLSFVSDLDTQAVATSPTTTYGTAKALTSDGGGEPVESFLRFTVPPLTGQIVKAELRLYVTTNGTTNGPKVYGTNTNWSETDLAWNNRPTPTTPLIADTGSLSRAYWATWDVTSFVTASGPYAFILQADSSDGVKFSSREGAQPPQLVVFLGSSTMVPSATATTIVPQPTTEPATPTATEPATPTTTEPATPTGTPFYAFYYMWWSTRHWQERLGAGYPFDGSWPIPGSVDPATECNTTTNFPGGIISDVPQNGAYDLLTSSIMETHVRQAAATGLTGFLAAWEGTGLPNQQVTDRGYNRRLERLVQIIEAHNQTANRPFQFIVDYEIFGEDKPLDVITNDLDYVLSRYSTSPAWAKRDGKLMVRWSNTRLFPIETLKAVSDRYRDRVFLIGEERSTTWSSERAQYLDGTGHYWSTQDPWGNPQSFQQEQEFAAKVRADGKLWFAPLAPGYNDQLQDQQPGQPVDPNDCVPRKGGQTMRALFEGNRTTNPNGWFVISWNEWVEHTYIEPSKRYGTVFIDELARIISDANQ